MFCPECGEVVGPGPIDRRRASYCQCGTAEQKGPIGRLARAIGSMFRRAEPIEDRAQTATLSDTASRRDNDRLSEE
jgi:hypothetical protein